MKSRRMDFKRLVLIGGVVFQVAWYLLLWTRFVASPELKGADFISFYTAGVIARSHQPSQIYDLQLQHDLQQEIVGKQISSTEFLPFLHPPFLVPLQELIAGSDYRVAYELWSLILLTFLAVAAILLWYMLRSRGWERKTSALAVISVILFYPTFISLLKGQDTAFLLMGAFLWLLGFMEEKDWLAGAGLALTMIRPQLALALAIPFLFKRRKIFLGFLLGGATLAVYSFLMLGMKGTQSFISTLFLSASGEGYGLNQAGMFNLTGMLLRLAPGLDPGIIQTIGWIFLATTLTGLCILWGRSKELGARHIALAVALSLLAAPHLHYHDLALLVIALAGLGLAGVRAGRLRPWQAAALPMIVSVILLVSEFWDPVRFSVPYILMAGIPVVTWIVEHAKKD